MPNKHYAIYEVKSNNNRIHLGDCYGQVPSRCLRKVAFKNEKKTGVKKVIDVEEKISGNVDKPIIRYTAVSALFKTSDSKRQFKKERGIGDPDHEVRVEILQTDRLIKRSNGTIQSKKNAVRTAEKDKSPVRPRKKALAIDNSDFVFQLLSSTPTKLTYELHRGQEKLTAGDFVSMLETGNPNLLSVLRRAFIEAGKQLNEFAFVIPLSGIKGAVVLECRQIQPTAIPSTLDLSKFTPLTEPRPANILESDSSVSGTLLIPMAPVGGQDCQSIAKYFSKASKQNTALLQRIGTKAKNCLQNNSACQIQASTQPYCRPIFQIKPL